MSSLSSASTLTQIEAAYIDNASYAEDGSTTKARAFITACRILLLKIPKATGSREGTLQLNPELLQAEIDRAQAWLAANEAVTDAAGRSVGSVSRGSFRSFRD